ncbi:right-handed parallel beta-helix repeat-containing protein [bacterium]|nr:right-handed parallel beta-helix repeat-containing protein [bacterium]
MSPAALRAWALPMLVVVAVGGVLVPAMAGEVKLYVARGGNDQATGKLPDPQGINGPFATLQRAQQEVRRLRAGSPQDAVIVFVRGGTYELPAALQFGPEDSGTSTAPVTYRAYPGEKPLLVGARKITGFHPYKGQILQASLQNTPLAKTVFRQLFFRGERMVMARCPNVDPSDPHGGKWEHVAAVDGDQVQDHFTAMPGVVKDWTKVSYAEVGIFPQHDWAWNILRVKSADKAEGTVTLAGKTSYDMRVGDRYFVQNLLEELDAPGEWYLDRDTSTLYFWPPADVNTGEVLAAVMDSVVVIKGARYVNLRGFTVEACDGDAVVLDGCERCEVAQCTVRNCGAWGVRINGGTNSGAFGNDVYATGSGGISLSGGDRKTLQRGDNYATNNYVHHVAAFNRTYNTAINCSGVGNRADHNLIHDTPHAGMTLSGNDNLVEYNLVHHTNLQSADTGGIYFCSRDWTQRNNTIRYNIFHHCGGYGKINSWSPVSKGKIGFHYPGFTWGIYLDDPTTGTLVYGNILWSVPICALHNHGGRDNTWENNILVDCPAINEGMLAPNWGEWPSIYQKLRDNRQPGSPYLERYPELADYKDTRPEEMSGVRFLRNIVYYTEEGTRWLREENQSGWQGGQLLYQLRMTKEDFAKNEWDYNLVYAPAGMEVKIRLDRQPDVNELMGWEKWRSLGVDQHSVLADPLFVDAANHDYRLKPESPALKLGFQQIPTDRIGCFADDRRASWPIVEAPGASARGEFTTLEYVDLPGYGRTPAREVNPRKGLGTLAAKLAAKQPIKVAYFGGGIHPSSGWRAELLKTLRAHYPGVEVSEIDAGICDCVRGSSFSTFRFRHDVLDKKPDLVLVDFASDDRDIADQRSIWLSMEGIVRQAWSTDPKVEFLFLYAFRDGYQADYREGMSPVVVSAYERVSEHYGIPSINLGVRVEKLEREGKLVVKATAEEAAKLTGKIVFSADGTRPSAAANQLYAQTIAEGLAQIAAASTAPTEALHVAALAKRPINANNMERARQVPITADMLTGQWQKLSPLDPLSRQFARHFDSIWYTNTPGAKLTFRFKGTEAGFFNLMGPDTGIARMTVDGTVVGTRQQVDPWSYYQRLSGLSIAGGLPDTEHTVVVELLPDVPNRAVPIAESKKAGRYRAEDFEGVALRFGFLRIVGEMLP